MLVIQSKMWGLRPGFNLYIHCTVGLPISRPMQPGEQRKTDDHLKLLYKNPQKPSCFWLGWTTMPYKKNVHLIKHVLMTSQNYNNYYSCSTAYNYSTPFHSLSFYLPSVSLSGAMPIICANTQDFMNTEEGLCPKRLCLYKLWHLNVFNSRINFFLLSLVSRINWALSLLLLTNYKPGLIHQSHKFLIFPSVCWCTLLPQLVTLCWEIIIQD